MIRFSCPGCAATYSVDDSKGGKTGKCPKCASQFQIPMPEAGGSSAPEPAAFPSAPPPPPPLSTPGDVSGNSTVEIDPCPGCQARLSVSGSDLGIDVECPYCKTVYKAVKAGSRPPAPPPAPPASAVASATTMTTTTARASGGRDATTTTTMTTAPGDVADGGAAAAVAATNRTAAC